MSGKITLAAVKGMQRGEVLRDGELKGFQAVRWDSDVVSFIVEKRINGRKRRITIGKWKDPWTPELARREAEEIILRGRRGEDVGEARKEARRRGKMLGEVFDDYIESHVVDLKPATQDSYKRCINNRLRPEFGTKAIDELTFEDVKKFHRGLKDLKRTANLAVAVLASVITWARENKYCAKDLKATQGIELYEENQRERYLDEDEAERLALVLRQAAKDGKVSAYILGQIWAIVFLGARKSEIRYLKWDYLDARVKGADLPDSKTGARRIPLNSFAREIFSKVPRIEGNPYIFPNRKGKPQEIAHKVWKKLREAAKIPDVRIHDLRHSFGAVAMDIDGSERALAKVIGHKKGRSTKRYAHVRASRAERLSEDTAKQIAKMMGLDAERKPLKARLRVRPLRTDVGATS